MPQQQKKSLPPGLRPLLLWTASGIALAVLVILGLRASRKQETTPPVRAAALAEKTEAAVFAAYGKSPGCKSCHEEEYKLWESSHHALAEREIAPAADAIAFEPARKIRHASQTSEALRQNNRFELTTIGIDGNQNEFVPQRVIGVDPLRQFLIPAPGGRLQVTELAFDPKRSDWFDVYGEEDRRPGEWGHWTGRGMTWNTMCAACHNTRLRKHYDATTDSYSTTMAEMGVGCEACHGPMAAHNAFQLKKEAKPGGHDPTLRRLDRDQMFSVCGSCHSRRAELTGDFFPGESFFDHYALSIPDETDLFYPDGQIRDEDYEFNAFLGSRMKAAGIRCIECHEPHSGKTRVAGNDLCMVCHAAPTPPAPKIDPATHTHHQPGSKGANCVDCHMPQTVYMQRHSRHDHGFTIPDPLLTKQLGIPNACARCHSDRGVDWTIEAAQKWYGERMNRPARARAQLLARARNGDAGSADGLLRLLRGETNSFWRAVSVNLLRRWAALPAVTAALLSSAGDPDPLVRAMSVRALEPLAQPANPPVQLALRNRLNDPLRSVRIDAAWAWRASLDTNSVAGADLLHYLRHSGDQPGGALQHGVFCLDRGDVGLAVDYFNRAIQWDTNSAPPHHALAVALSMQGKSEEAVRELQIACRLAPRDAEYQFKLGLALNESGKLDQARVALEQAVKLEPQFAQAWYNLGLAYNTSGQTESALESLVRAESIDANSPKFPYARATILARLGRIDDARNAARRALEIQPAYAEATELLRSLDR